ncbi:MAG: hypothetical protein KJ749_03695 [Planctomycetes bacterium]|nr:hypothetical protein [Planctomycetota bacterium]
MGVNGGTPGAILALTNAATRVVQAMPPEQDLARWVADLHSRCLDQTRRNAEFAGESLAITQAVSLVDQSDKDRRIRAREGIADSQTKRLDDLVQALEYAKALQQVARTLGGSLWAVKRAWQVGEAERKAPPSEVAVEAGAAS